MKFFFDTSILVEIERENRPVIETLKKLINNEHELLISTITISEILTGSYLTKNTVTSINKARRVLSQFKWINFDYRTAQKTAQILAFLRTEGKIIGYPDAAIAASFIETKSDFMITLNKTHFLYVPDLKGKVYEPKEIGKILK